MRAPTLHTERLILRAHVLADYEPLAAFYQTDHQDLVYRHPAPEVLQ